MTVVVGFVGPDGAVMASDSEATEGADGLTRYDVEKIWTCGDLLCGYTGMGAVRDRLARAMDEVLPQVMPQRPNRHQLADVLQQIAQPVLRHVYSNFVPTQPGQDASRLAGILLVIGRDDDGYWLLELDYHNTASFYTDAGFHTVGSGSAAAYVARALMKGYNVGSREMKALRLVAYRMVGTCIDSLGGRLGVGGHVQMWSSQNGAPFAKCEGEELESVRDGVEQWTVAERESLDQVLSGGSPQPPAEAAAALPEDFASDAPAEGKADAIAADAG